MARYSTSSILLIFSFFAVMGYVIYSFMTLPLNPIAYILPFFTFFLVMLSGNLGEYTGFVLKNKNFITAGGGIGVVRSVNIYGGGMIGYVVTTWSRTKGIKKWRKSEDTLGGFASFFSITSTIEITDKAYRFHDLPEHYCDLKEGAIFYDGTFNGIEIPNKYDHLLLQIDYLYATLSKAQTIFEKSKSIAAAAAQEANLDMLEAIKKTTIAISDIAKTMRPPAPRQTVLPPDGG